MNREQSGETQTRIVALNGEAKLVQRPAPLPGPEFEPAEMVCSGISPGTELLILDMSRDSSEEHLLGYQGVARLNDGSLVACYGAPYVHHANVLQIPRHCMTPLPKGADAADFAYGTLGCTALHGFRQSGAGLGDVVVVIGLGMLGNYTAQTAKAAGCQVLGLDISPARQATAIECGIEVCTDLESLGRTVLERSHGGGADAVIIAATNTGSELLDAAFEMVRRLGQIVILGLSDAQLPRQRMFAKEATLRVSRSGGWGRYDAKYEREGQDYPLEHARWTEHRNLMEYVRLVSLGLVKTRPMITHEVNPEEVPGAYEKIRDRPGEYLGVVVRW